MSHSPEKLFLGLLNLLRGTEVERTNAQGNAVHTMFLSTERYVVDFGGQCSTDPGAPDQWCQFDTDQDAAYFGVWVHENLRQVLTYAEGDWSLVICPDLEHFKAEVQALLDFYTPGRFAASIDKDGGLTEHFQDRSLFLPS